MKWNISAADLADDVNLLGSNIDAIKQKIETLIDAGKEVGLEVNAGKTKYMLLFRHQNAGQNHDMKIANRSFENILRSPFQPPVTSSLFGPNILLSVLNDIWERQQQIKI
jgi:hypothetical protein